MNYEPKTFEPKTEARTKWDMERVCAFDIEASDWTDAITLGMDRADQYVPDGESSYIDYWKDTDGDVIECFVDEIMRPKYRNARFVAHNGGGYDFLFIIDEINKRDYDYMALTKGSGDIFYVEITDDDGKKRHLQDSMALMPRGLATLTASFCPDMAKKEPSRFDVSSLPSDPSTLDRQARAALDYYQRRDCRSLRIVLDRFTSIVEDLTDGRASCQLTVGATSMAAYQTAFMADSDVTAIRQAESETLETFARESYYGGRTEVFRMSAPPSEAPDGGYYHYDVNSLYPTAYTETRLPTGRFRLLREENYGAFLRGTDGWNEYGGVVEITGTVPESVDIPVLPVREETDAGSERVLFRTGSITGTYMIREVRYALENGYLEDVTVHSAAYSKYGRPFENYGNALYDIKKSIDSDEQPGKYNAVKFLLNSFYGKFGMDRDQSSLVRFSSADAMFSAITDDDETYRPIGRNEKETARLMDSGIVSKDETAESAYIIPRLASAITAEARLIMHDYFRQARAKGGRIWYCDTDSIVTDVPLETGGELGEMDLEGRIDEAYFLAPKTYAERHADGSTTLKAKGMRNLSEYEEFTDDSGTHVQSEAVKFDDYREAILQDDPTRICTKWKGVRGGTAAIKDGSAIQTDDYSRSLQSFDSKRVHADDGLSSRPIHQR